VVLIIGQLRPCTFRRGKTSLAMPPALTDPTDPTRYFRTSCRSFRRKDFQTNLIMPDPRIFLSGNSRPALVLTNPHKWACNRCRRSSSRPADLFRANRMFLCFRSELWPKL